MIFLIQSSELINSIKEFTKFIFKQTWKKIDVYSPRVGDCTSSPTINFINFFIEFINSDDYIRKITSKSIRIYPVFI